MTFNLIDFTVCQFEGYKKILKHSLQNQRLIHGYLNLLMTWNRLILFKGFRFDIKFVVQPQDKA